MDTSKDIADSMKNVQANAALSARILCVSLQRGGEFFVSAADESHSQCNRIAKEYYSLFANYHYYLIKRILFRHF